MLRKTGFAVLEAADGVAAIELLRASGRKIDVILLDMTIAGASTPQAAIYSLSDWYKISVRSSSRVARNRFERLITGRRCLSSQKSIERSA
jgi:hypothetical protein